MKQCFKFVVVVIIGFLCSTTKGTAQQVKAEAKLDSTSIRLGDQTMLHIRVRFPSSDSLSFPEIPDMLSEDIQLVHKSKIDTVFDTDDFRIKTLSQDLTITSFEAGAHVIPAFNFHTKTDSVQTDSIYLDVLSVQVDTSKSIYDIKQPLGVAYSWIDWLRDHWTWAVLTLVLILLIIGFFYFRKKIPQKQAKPEAPKPEIPAHQIALERLRELKEKKLWQQEQVKQYHIELSDIVREYLEKRYHVQALEQTSGEIFASLKYMDIPQKNRNELRQLLILADL